MKIIPTRPWGIYLAVGTAFVLAGCSGGSSSSSGAVARKTGACKLLTTDQVQRVLGQPIKPARQGSSAGGGQNEGAMTNCHWDAASQALHAPDVTLMVWTWPAGTKGAQNYINSLREVAKSNAGVAKPEPVPLGDEAIWDGRGIDARKGGVNISLAVVGPDKPTARQAAMKLSKDVLDKL